MNKYRIEYAYADGFTGEVEMYAEDSHAAVEAFEGFASEDIVNTECFYVDDEEEE